MTKHCILVGNGVSLDDFMTGKRMFPPPDIMKGEVWGITAAGLYLNCDRVFHMDQFEDLEGYWGAENLGRFAALRCPLYTARRSKVVPNALVYPIKKVVEFLGLPYLTSTAAYALAMAMCEGYTDISLYGMDFTYREPLPAAAGRGCFEFWLSKAMHVHGINIHLAPGTTLFELRDGMPLYGYELPYDAVLKEIEDNGDPD